MAHLRPQQKLRDVERDPRVVLSLEGATTNAVFRRCRTRRRGQRLRITPERLGGIGPWS